jgi:polyhydroxyalkanoate synthesis repressor PhaR
MKKRLIKRYSNRKLYDTETKSYISLNDIAEFIREELAVEILDNETGKDLTNQVLTQIIFEEGKKGNSTIPSDVLHEMIRWGGRVIDQGVEQVVNGVDRLVHDSLRKWISPAKSAEIEQLQQKVSYLESLIENLTQDIENQTNKS